MICTWKSWSCSWLWTNWVSLILHWLLVCCKTTAPPSLFRSMESPSLGLADNRVYPFQEEVVSWAATDLRENRLVTDKTRQYIIHQSIHYPNQFQWEVGCTLHRSHPQRDRPRSLCWVGHLETINPKRYLISWKGVKVSVYLRCSPCSRAITSAQKHSK